jgi:hypothetical protein
LDETLQYHKDALKINRDIGYRQGEASDVDDYPKDVALRVQHGFKSTPYVGQWLSKVWNALQGLQEQEDEKRNIIEEAPTIKIQAKLI